MDIHPKVGELLENLKKGPKSTVAGVGSRKLPAQKSELLFKAAFLSVLTEQTQYASGGAPGSDATIEHGVKAALGVVSEGREYESLVNQYLKVYLPGYFFNGRSSKHPGMIDATKLPMHEQAKQLAKEVHPAFKVPKEKRRPMKPYVLNLHARNGHQALGEDLSTPVRSVLCFTGDGAKGSRISVKTGGTGQALRLADRFNIPVLNIGSPKDEASLMKWIEKRGAWLKQTYGIDVDYEHHRYVAEFTAGVAHHKGDLLEDIEKLNLDIIVHDCNCFNTMDSGISNSIKEKFPSAFEADLQTIKGSKSKLGTFSSAEISLDGRSLTIVNAYTQFKYGTDSELYFDYDAFKDVLISLNETFPGATVGFPRIGSGRAGGCWLTIAEMIKNHAPRINTVVVSRQSDLEYKPEARKTRDREGEQIGLGF